MRRLLLLSALACSSCFVVTDLDRFEKRGQNNSNFSDLRLTLRGFTSHVNEYFEYRVVDASNVIQSRGIVVPLGGTGTTIFARSAVPKQNGPFRLDFFSDHDNIPGYTDVRPGQNGDHAWRIPLDDSRLDDNGAYVVLFDHNTSFNFLSEPSAPTEFGKPAVVRLRNMGGFLNKRVEVRVADASSGRVVALYRVPVLTTPELDATVPGMIELGVLYQVELYTDDGNSTPASVQAFRKEVRGTDTGLDVPMDPTAPDVVRVDDAPSP